MRCSSDRDSHCVALGHSGRAPADDLVPAADEGAEHLAELLKAHNAAPVRVHHREQLIELGVLIKNKEVKEDVQYGKVRERPLSVEPRGVRSRTPGRLPEFRLTFVVSYRQPLCYFYLSAMLLSNSV